MSRRFAMASPMTTVFVTATGTDVGKTFVTAQARRGAARGAAQRAAH